MRISKDIKAKNQEIIRTDNKNSPIGTEESKMTKPTFDHFPSGSRFTPLLISAWKDRNKKIMRVG